MITEAPYYRVQWKQAACRSMCQSLTVSISWGVVNTKEPGSILVVLRARVGARAAGQSLWVEAGDCT